ncbi:GNAT family N-acetyltransferase [Bacillus pinisoli]|uniref:GNAT family N-acetyltransferase n=1 Tax=Bacillus pinisoli TaxID=2901866 RepID=UPI001FF2193D|nr:GNAT family N-acetyltransferase [Bacillus pinisoli]
MDIRPALVEDANAIAKVHVDSWRTTYKDIVSQSYLDELSVEAREKLWKTVIPSGGVYVAENDIGQIVGFVSGGRERTAEYPEFLGEVYAIYLFESEQRKGVGKQLIKAVKDDLNSKGINSMLIWVLEENPSAGFYESIGGQRIDSMEVAIGNAKYVEVAFGWKDIQHL